MPMPEIVNDAFTALANAYSLPPIVYPNEANPAIPTDTHLRAYILPADTESIGLSSWDVERGIIQVSVYEKQGAGIINAYSIAQQILALFPRGFSASGFKVHRAGSIGPAMIDGAWLAIAVSIPYENVR
jgi:hypothetical protein